jgi:hypothetical protein
VLGAQHARPRGEQGQRDGHRAGRAHHSDRAPDPAAQGSRGVVRRPGRRAGSATGSRKCLPHRAAQRPRWPALAQCSDQARPPPVAAPDRRSRPAPDPGLGRPRIAAVPGAQPTDSSLILRPMRERSAAGDRVCSASW